MTLRRIINRIDDLRRRPWLPVVIALVVFVLARPFLDRFAQAVVPPITSVGVTITNGYQQVYFINSNGTTFITSGTRNHTQPLYSGDWVAYLETINGADQVMLYSLQTGITTQLTSGTTHRRVKMDTNKLVWEEWSTGTNNWQIFYYNGSSATRLATGIATSVVRPDISGDSITYVTKLGNGSWEAYRYTISTSGQATLGTGSGFAWPRLSGGSVVYGYQNNW